MPELPEVECIRRTLEPHLVGATIVSVRVLRADIVGPRAGRAQRKAASARALSSALLDSQRIDRLERRGKQLAIIAQSGAGLVVHLGMSGRLTLAKADEPLARHTHVIWELAPIKGQQFAQLRFVDPRRFGFLLTFADPSALEQLWGDMGPDALALADARHADARSAVADAIRATRRPIKPVLLDQRVIAGVGNIYADEACFAAKLDPHRSGHSLTAPELARLLDAAPQILQAAIDCGGTTRRDYVDALGRRGSAQDRHAVYDRAGQACLVCHRPLASDRLGGRTTVWCPRCQT